MVTPDAVLGQIAASVASPSLTSFVEVLPRPIESTQYTALAFGQRCTELGVRPSRSSIGDCYDNAMAESFFATLECELLDRYRFRTHAEAKLAIFRFIEGWYYPRRRHSACGNQSPMRYELLNGTAHSSAA